MATKLSAELAALVLPGLDKWLPNAVDAWLEGEGAEKPRVDPGWWHPSSLSEMCEGALASQYLGIPRVKPIAARTRRIFDNGHGRDKFWKDYLYESGISLLKQDWKAGPCPGCGEQVWVEDLQMLCHATRHICLPSVHIRGEFDDFIATPDGPRIFECKTKNDDLWKMLKGPDPDHVIQVQPYMVAMNVPSALIVYENKNDQNVKCFEIVHNAAMWEGVLQRLDTVLTKLREGYEIVRGNCDWDCQMFDFRAAVEERRELVFGTA